MENVSARIGETVMTPQPPALSASSVTVVASMADTRDTAGSHAFTSKPRSPHRAESWTSFVSSTSTFLVQAAGALTLRTTSTYTLVRTQLTALGAPIIARLAGILGFLIACVALWSTLSAMADSRQALELARWTALKDFLEHCQANNYSTPECDKENGINNSLGRPPIPRDLDRASCLDCLQGPATPTRRVIDTILGGWDRAGLDLNGSRTSGYMYMGGILGIHEHDMDGRNLSWLEAVDSAHGGDYWATF